MHGFESVHVIGCGGIGSWLLPGLAKHLDNLDDDRRPALVLWDGDRVEEHNCQRQNFYPSDVGANKAEILARAVGDMYPNLRVEGRPQFVGQGQLSELHDALVLAGPDNHVCRHLVLCQARVAQGCAAVIGGNEVSDGSVVCFRTVAQVNTITKRFPEIEGTDDGDRSEMSCAQLAELPGGRQTMIANIVCAAIMLQYAVLMLDGRMPPVATYFDTVTGATRPIPEG